VEHEAAVKEAFVVRVHVAVRLVKEVQELAVQLAKEVRVHAELAQLAASGLFAVLVSEVRPHAVDEVKAAWNAVPLADAVDVLPKAGADVLVRASAAIAVKAAVCSSARSEVKVLLA